MIKIAFATDDLMHISAHLGRAQKYLVYTIEKGHVTTQEERSKPFHDQGHEDHSHHEIHFHDDMVNVIADCQVVIARGMGSPAFERVVSARIQPILTELSTIQEALQAYIEGHLEHRPNRIH